MAGCACQITDLTVPQGPQGLQGEYGGNSLDWNFSTGGVSNGKLRTNGANTAFSAIAQFNVNETDPASTDVSAWLNAISQNDRIKVFVEDDNTKFGIYTVGAISTSGDERVIPVTVISSNGSMANGESVVISHALTGSTGATGPAGANGTTVLDIDLTEKATTTVGSWDTLKSVTPTTGLLAANDDAFQIDFVIMSNIGASSIAQYGDYKVEMIEGGNTVVLFNTQVDTGYRLVQHRQHKVSLLGIRTSSVLAQPYREITIGTGGSTDYTNRTFAMGSNNVSVGTAQSITLANSIEIRISGQLQPNATTDAIKVTFQKITLLKT